MAALDMCLTVFTLFVTDVQIYRPFAQMLIGSTLSKYILYDDSSVWWHLTYHSKLIWSTMQTLSLYKVCENTGFRWPVFSRIKTKSTILSLHRRIRVRENPHFRIFYAVFWLSVVGETDSFFVWGGWFLCWNPLWLQPGQQISVK